jgi:hypothetical protein
MAHASKRPDHGMNWDAGASRHRRVMPVSRLAYERWMLTLCGTVLLGLTALLGWGGYSLAVVKAELKQLRAMVEHSAQGSPHEEASAQRPPEQGEPTASPRLPRAGVNQGMSRGDVAGEHPSEHMEDQPRPVPPSQVAAGGGRAPRIVVHIRSAAQRQAAQSITTQFTPQGYVFPKAAILVERGPRQTQVRYFRHVDAQEAAHVAALLTRVHRQPVVSRFIPGYADSPRLQPRHYEVWLAPDPG